VGRQGDGVPQGWNVEFRWYKDDDLIAVVLANRRIRAGSIRRYATPHLVDITLFGRTPQLPAFAATNPAELRRLAGSYKLESGGVFHVNGSEAATGDPIPRPILIISGEGQQAIDLLFSGNQLPGLTKLSLELNDKTKAYIDGLRTNDVVAVRAIPAESSSAEGALKSWENFVSRNGDLEKIEVLGTS